MNRRTLLANRLVPGFAALIASAVTASAVVFTTDTTINPANTNYDGQDIIVSNTTLTVDGPHTFASLLVASNSVLTHTFSTNGILSDTISVTNELHTLVGTNSATLLNSNVVTASVVVTDTGATVTYTTNADYVLTTPSAGLTGLRRTTNSTIPDGTTVYVSYEATVTAGLNLTLTGSLEVATGGVINVNGRGFGGNTGTGNGGETGGPQSGAGAGHAGYGGNSSSNAIGGNCYGVFNQPVTLGSGGGQGVGGVGGNGGGAVKLAIGGGATIDGIISANGADATNSRSGGGSGGSVWITAHTVSGTGTITAHGGNGEPIHGGGAGGGRISIQSETNNFTGTMGSHGGLGGKSGGAGTVYTQTNYPSIVSPGMGMLVLDNGGRAGTNSNVSLTGAPDVIIRGNAGVIPTGLWRARNVTIASNSFLVVFSQNSSISVITTNMTLEAGGTILADKAGYVANSGPGTPFDQGGGGGYGGLGGRGTNSNFPGGNSYGTVNVTTYGSGGGGISSFGGKGGGSVALSASDMLRIDGTISANGGNASSSASASSSAGGGSGGGIGITAGTFCGAGSITTHGGDGYPLYSGGGGGGGRITVRFDTNLFAGTIAAYGGNGANRGGAGTIYLRTNSLSAAHVFVDNGGLTNAGTPFSDSTIDLTVSGGGIVLSGFSGFAGGFRNAWIKTNGTMTGIPSTSLQSYSFSGNLTIDEGGVFFLDGLGYTGGQGPGAGANLSDSIPRGGGGHGGFGAVNPGYGTYGGAYDSITSPNLAGSGGGNTGSPTYSTGGAGGGAARLLLNGSGVLTVNGRLSANGLPGITSSGGGSGGSIWITTGTIAGAGIISANGGPGSSNAGGGGGGRISIGYNSNFFTGQITANGGVSSMAGGAGTIYTKANGALVGQLFLNNGGLAGTNTPLSSAFSLPNLPFNLSISGGADAVALTALQLSNLTVNAGSVLTVQSNELFLNVLRDVTIDTGGAITADGRGFGRAAGAGAGASLSSKGAGGGYGGAGGNSQSGAAGGMTNGSATQPVDRGSGGGAGANAYFGGSEGGGAIHLNVGGALNVAGRLSADGAPGLQDDSGGGSGGSLWISASAVTGNGIISADGGHGDLSGGGGGGGGRIAIYSPANSFVGSISASGGMGANAGQPGTLFLETNLFMFAISGRVTNATGQAVTSVLLQPSGGLAATTTDVDGNYTMGVPYGWTGTVTPSLGTNVFVPGIYPYSSVVNPTTDKNHLMVATIAPSMSLSLSGTNLSLNWLGIPGVTYQPQHSTNLVTWLPYGPPLPGTNGWMQLLVPTDGDPLKFVRLRAAN